MLAVLVASVSDSETRDIVEQIYPNVMMLFLKSKSYSAPNAQDGACHSRRGSRHSKRRTGVTRRKLKESTGDGVVRE
jgi:hypothetical protein